MKRLIMAMAAALALSACAHGPKMVVEPPIPPVPFAVETITYDTSACKGSCPVYRVSVSSDGTGVFTGVAHVAVIGERRFTVTPEQFAAFRDRLKPWLPESGVLSVNPGTPLCKRDPTDFPSVGVTWSRPPVQRSALGFYYGCSFENPDMGKALGNAPDAIPALAPLIGEIP